MSTKRLLEEEPDLCFLCEIPKEKYYRLDEKTKAAGNPHLRFSSVLSCLGFETPHDEEIRACETCRNLVFKISSGIDSILPVLNRKLKVSIFLGLLSLIPPNQELSLISLKKKMTPIAEADLKRVIKPEIELISKNQTLHSLANPKRILNFDLQGFWKSIKNSSPMLFGCLSLFLLLLFPSGLPLTINLQRYSLCSPRITSSP